MLKTILTVVFVLICVALTVIVLLQEGKSSGLGSISGMADKTDVRSDRESAMSARGRRRIRPRLIIPRIDLLPGCGTAVRRH